MAVAAGREERAEAVAARPAMRVRPWWANWRTQARPMEPPAPVIRATLDGGGAVS